MPLRCALCARAVIVFGSGGKLVEVMKDTALALPPLNQHLASNLIHGTKIAKVMRGFRGQPPVNEERLADILVRFSTMLLDQRFVREVDINPVLACGDRVIAVDARVALYPEGTPLDKIPVSGFRTYPIEYVQPISLANHDSVLLRPVADADVPAMAAFLKELAEPAVVGVKRALPVEARVDPERLTRICFADYERNHTIIAEQGHDIIGVGRMLRVIPSDGIVVACIGVRQGSVR